MDDYGQRYAQAVAAEQEGRLAAFALDHDVVCGVRVRPLSLRHCAILELIGSPLMCGGLPTQTDLLQALYVLSPDYDPHDPRGRARWVGANAGKVPLRKVGEIRAWFDDSLADLPGGKRADRKPATSWAASMVDVLAHEYGWSEREILDMPVRRVWQYVRRIMLRNDSHAVFIDKSDRIKSDWLAALNAEKETPTDG